MADRKTTFAGGKMIEFTWHRRESIFRANFRGPESRILTPALSQRIHHVSSFKEGVPPGRDDISIGITRQVHAHRFVGVNPALAISTGAAWLVFRPDTSIEPGKGDLVIGCGVADPDTVNAEWIVWIRRNHNRKVADGGRFFCPCMAGGAGDEAGMFVIGFEVMRVLPMAIGAHLVVDHNIMRREIVVEGPLHFMLAGIVALRAAHTG